MTPPASPYRARDRSQRRPTRYAKINTRRGLFVVVLIRPTTHAGDEPQATLFYGADLSRLPPCPVFCAHFHAWHPSARDLFGLEVYNACPRHALWERFAISPAESTGSTLWPLHDRPAPAEVEVPAAAKRPANGSAVASSSFRYKHRIGQGATRCCWRECGSTTRSQCKLRLGKLDRLAIKFLTAIGRDVPQPSQITIDIDVQSN